MLCGCLACSRNHPRLIGCKHDQKGWSTYMTYLMGRNISSALVKLLLSSHIVKLFRPCTCPTNDYDWTSYLIEMYFLNSQSNHSKILHIPRQHSCLAKCKILLWSSESSLNYSNGNFDGIRNVIISIVEQAPYLTWGWIIPGKRD